MTTKEIDVLGSKYKIIYVQSNKEKIENFPHLLGCYAITLSTSRTIIIQDFDDEIPLYTDAEGGYDNNFIPLRNSALRHEIVHAYLNECGLRVCAKGTGDSAWSRNEEMVDWFAILSPKIFKTYEELNILDQ